LVQTEDYFDGDLPEDAFKEGPAPKRTLAQQIAAKATPGKGSGFTYDPVTGLPKIAGLEADADGQIDYDNLVQMNKPEAPKAAAPSFGYDHATGLPVVFGDPVDYDHDFIQVRKDAPKAAAVPSFSYDKVTGLPVIGGEAIDFDHDFVQFSGEPINVALEKRNLLQTGEDWMTAQQEFRVENNIPEPKERLYQEGIWNTVVTI